MYLSKENVFLKTSVKKAYIKTYIFISHCIPEAY